MIAAPNPHHPDPGPGIYEGTDMYDRVISNKPAKFHTKPLHVRREMTTFPSHSRGSSDGNYMENQFDMQEDYEPQTADEATNALKEIDKLENIPFSNDKYKIHTAFVSQKPAKFTNYLNDLPNRNEPHLKQFADNYSVANDYRAETATKENPYGQRPDASKFDWGSTPKTTKPSSSLPKLEDPNKIKF